MAITKDGRAIASLEDWLVHAPPKSAGHWVEGRSAMEVARAWLEGRGADLPPEVLAALAAHRVFGPVRAWAAEPEARLLFDDFPGEPRNTDLLVVGRRGGRGRGVRRRRRGQGGRAIRGGGRGGVRGGP